ncbi:MAG: hypothetical protein GXO47_06630 [Chlorobi bacterium]|nr:hypothetical protein [Chlorobiota bacterium]
MRGLIISILAVFMFSFNVLPEGIEGLWLLKKAGHDNKIQDIYATLNFDQDGKFLMNGENIGEWSYSNGTVNINSVFKELSGSYEIKGTDNDFRLSGSDMVLYLQRLNRKTIISNNQESGIEGSWNLPVEFGKKTLIFKLPDVFTTIEEDDGVTTTRDGNWIFSKNENKLIFLLPAGSLKGEATIIEKSDRLMTLDHNEKILKLTRNEAPAISEERLNWTEDDFYTADGEYKYEDNDKLPWSGSDVIADYYSNLQNLTYTFYNLVDESGLFETNEVVSHINVEGTEIPNAEDVFKKYPQGDNKIQTYDDFSYIFPVNCDVFRVAGNEQITTPAGIFDCTVVESMGEMDEKVKIWMINDKPGVVAKVIKDLNESPFGHYWVFELKEIKTK